MESIEKPILKNNDQCVSVNRYQSINKPKNDYYYYFFCFITTKRKENNPLETKIVKKKHKISATEKKKQFKNRINDISYLKFSPENRIRIHTYFCLEIARFTTQTERKEHKKAKQKK